MKLRLFYKRLEAHDWWHMMADSPSIYEKGSRDLAELVTISKESRKHQSLFERFRAHAKEGKRKPKIPPL